MHSNSEIELLVRAKNGDKACIEKVIKDNLGFVYKISKNIKTDAPIDFEDLVSQGVVGILKALKNYDTKKDIKFLTYAYLYIKNEIFDYANKSNFSVKISYCKLREYLKLKKEEENLDISNKLKDFDMFKRSNTISFDNSSINHYQSIETDIIHVENKIYFQQLIKNSKLTKQEAFVIKGIFIDQVSMKSIGESLGVRASRVVKLKNIALTKIKNVLYEGNEFTYE